MKKILFLLPIIFAIISCFEAPKTTIVGAFDNVDDQMVYLIGGSGEINLQIDSVQMIDGKFILTTEDVFPRQVSIKFGSSNKSDYAFHLEKGTINIKGNFEDMRTIVVSGTPSNDALNVHNSQITEIATIAVEKMKAISANDKLTKVEKSSQDNLIYVKLKEDMSDIVNKAISENNDNIFGALMISMQPVKNYEQATGLLDKVSSNMPDNQYIKNLKDSKEKYTATKLGATAPHFTVKTPEGKDISPSSLKGQVVLLDFWASWCRPCRMANPKILELYNKYNKDGFTVFGISLDNNKNKWVNAIKEDKLIWHHGSSLSKDCIPTKLYNVTSVPTTFLINIDGVIVGRNLKGEALGKKIAELLK